MITLKKGKRYKLRNGITTSPMQLVEHAGSYKWEAKFEEHKGRPLTVGNWLQGGSYVAEQWKHHHDIVEELNDEQ